MLYSSTHKFIFIHISKNGGSSIRSYLDQFAVAQKKRSGFTNLMVSLPVKQRPENIVFPPHINARQARRKLGQDLYNQAFSFAIVRNPYDRAVSRFEYVKHSAKHHRHKRFNAMTFEDFIRHERLRNLFISRTQLSEISDANGDLIVSKIYKFEDFDSILPSICKKIGVQMCGSVPHTNSSPRKDYRSYFSAATRNEFEKIYRSDLDAFCYEF